MAAGSRYKLLIKNKVDANLNDIIDVAEGIRVVGEFPTDPSDGQIVMKDGRLYVKVGD